MSPSGYPDRHISAQLDSVLYRLFLLLPSSLQSNHSDEN
jgi:hypothetical protein